MLAYIDFTPLYYNMYRWIILELNKNIKSETIIA